MLPRIKQTSIDIIKVLNIIFIVASVLLCSILMLLRIPGMELLKINPNWLLIWLVAWSIKRNIWQGAIAGFALGCIHDGISIYSPSHILSFIVVGVLTSGLQKQKYIGEDFISIAFIVFLMSILAETIYALQYARVNLLKWSQVFEQYQQTVIISAIISSLWSPAFYYPFKTWDRQMKRLAKKTVG